MKRHSVKETAKRYYGKCFFCPESRYELLDAHRLVAGEDGGVYHFQNILVVCAGCHRKITTKVLVVTGRHQSTAGPVIIYRDENGTERIELHVPNKTG